MSYKNDVIHRRFGMQSYADVVGKIKTFVETQAKGKIKKVEEEY